MTDFVFPEPLAPNPLFVGAYIFLCSLMFLGCLFHAIKLGIWAYYKADRSDPWFAKITASLSQVLILVFFVAAYWVLESFAMHESPYYVYSAFPGGIPQLFSWLGSAPDTQGACPTFVSELTLGLTYNTIPFSVLMMESSLTYVAMWTALMLRARYYLIPIFAGLLSLNVDALMDPVVAVVYDCSGKVARGGSGLAFWHWYTDGVEMAKWHGVPLFNFAAWWAAPVALVSFVLLVQYLRNRFWRILRRRAPFGSTPVATPANAFGLFIAIVAMFFLVNQFRPDGGVPIAAQWLLMFVVIAGSVVCVYVERRRFDSSGRLDPWLTHPPLALIAVALVGLLLNGIFLDLPELLPFALVAVVVGLLLVLWPYEETVCGIARGVIDLDRYVRLHYFSYTSTLILLGGFAAGIRRGHVGIMGDELLWVVASLLGIAACFQIYAYLLNDVIDLELDSTQERRQRDPLVRGAVRWSSALALALVQVPSALLFIWMAGGRWPAYVALLAGFALMTAYNRWGKVCPFPPLTDAAQALAWGSLVWVGAFTVESGGTTHWPVVWSVFIFGSGFILLINGVHGGLRDLRNDAGRGRKTTARLLGAHCDDPAGQVRSTWRVAAFAFSVHTLMFALPGLVLLQDLSLGGSRDGWFPKEARLPAATIAVFLTFLLSNICLWNVVKPVEADHERDKWMEWDVFIVLLPLVFGSLPFLDLISAMALLFVFLAPLLAMENVVERIIRFTHPQLCERVSSPRSERREDTATERGAGERQRFAERQGRAALKL